MFVRQPVHRRRPFGHRHARVDQPAGHPGPGARGVLDDDGGRHDPVGLDVDARGLGVECGQGPLVPARHANTTPRSPTAADVPSSACLVIPGLFAPYAGRRQQEYGSLQFSGPISGDSPGLEGCWSWRSRSPSGAGCCPNGRAPLRGTLATTACMETLQVGYLHAVAAAAGCSLSQPFPDNGIDWHVSHGAPGHTVDDEVTIKVQLKCTYQIPPNPPGRSFSFTLDNDHLRKLARTPGLGAQDPGRDARARDPRTTGCAPATTASTCGTAATGSTSPATRSPAGPGPPCGYRPRASSTTARCARS